MTLTQHKIIIYNIKLLKTHKHERTRKNWGSSSALNVFWTRHLRASLHWSFTLESAVSATETAATSADQNNDSAELADNNVSQLIMQYIQLHHSTPQTALWLVSVGHSAWTQCIDAVYYYRCRIQRGLCVCVLGTLVSWAKMCELIEMPFGCRLTSA